MTMTYYRKEPKATEERQPWKADDRMEISPFEAGTMAINQVRRAEFETIRKFVAEQFVLNWDGNQ
jgi:hypothetical protein